MTSNIQILKNPKTEAYLDLKRTILSNEFNWFWNDKTTTHVEEDSTKHTNVPFLSHTFLQRPFENFLHRYFSTNEQDVRFPVSKSTYVQNVAKVFDEILYDNNIKVNCFLRLNVNCVLPLNKVANTVPHVDHNYPHENAIIYLTNAGGKIFVGDDSHDPREDDVICFKGLRHYHQTPERTDMYVRRIALVATFI